MFNESGLFGPVLHESYPWSRMHTASSYTDLLRTLSNHRLLAPEQLTALLAAIEQSINAHGGKFELRYETHLYMAARRN
jgi:hypothetical protein